MNIVCNSVILRAIDEKDELFCVELLNDPDIERTTVGKSFPLSVLNHRKWLQSQPDGRSLRLIVDTEEAGPIGMVSLMQIDWINRTAEVGIKMSNRRQRQAQNTRDACEGLLRYGFGELNLHCIYAFILEENVFSQKLMGLFGFSEEGILRDRVFKNNSYHDLVAYSLLQEEFFAEKCGR